MNNGRCATDKRARGGHGEGVESVCGVSARTQTRPEFGLEMGRGGQGPKRT